MAVTGRLRNRIIRKRFLCLGWGGPSVCCPSCHPSWSLHDPCVNIHFYFPPRSPCTSCGDLSGIHQGKGIWNTKLVSMPSYRCTIANTSTSLSIYAGLGVYVCSIINLCLFPSHSSFTILFLVVHLLLHLSPPSVTPLYIPSWFLIFPTSFLHHIHPS